MPDQIDLETDQFFLHNIINDTRSDYIANIIKQRFDRVIAYKAIDFKTNIVKIISECQAKHGIPMFRTRYADQPFQGNSALMVCYASHDGRMKGVWFKDIPDDDLRMMEAKADGYTQILRKYSSNIGENNMAGNYGRNYAGYGRSTSPHPITQDRLAALQEFKTWLEKAITDEQDAQRMYETMTGMARNLGLSEKATEIDLIRGQETNHERIFRDMLKDVNTMPR